MAAAEWSKSRNEPPRGFLGHRVRAGGGRNRDFRPDETNSNRLQDLFEVTDRAWAAEWIPGDDHLSPQGCVMEILSEHTCHGWLEGYLLTGRHGFFSCYEAFIHIVDSMVNQHAKWLKSANEIEWRRPIASLNYLLTSHVWRQDHNGFSHQDPGFVDHVANKKAEIVWVYFPGRSVARGVEEGSKQLLHLDDQANMCHPRESGDPAVGTRRSGDVSQEAVESGAKRQAP